MENMGIDKSRFEASNKPTKPSGVPDTYWSSFEQEMKDDPDQDTEATNSMIILLRELDVMAQVFLFDHKDEFERSREVREFISTHPGFSENYFQPWYAFPSGGGGDDSVSVLTSGNIGHAQAERIADLYYNLGAVLPEVPDNLGPKEEFINLVKKNQYMVIGRYQDNGNPCDMDFFKDKESLIEALEKGKGWENGAIYAIFDFNLNQDVMENFDSYIHDMYHTDS